MPWQADAAWVLGLAVSGTAIAIFLVAVVAYLVNGRLDDAITAAWGFLAGRTRCRTDVAGLELARVAAAIASVRVAIVAIFARFNALVATLGSKLAGLSSHALVARVLNRTGGIAPVIVFGVAVIAHLALADFTVAADDISGAFSFFGAGPVLLYFADAVATITGQYVAVIALFNAALIIDTVAAALRHLGDAASSACAGAVAPVSRGTAGRLWDGRIEGHTAGVAGTSVATATFSASPSAAIPA